MNVMRIVLPGMMAMSYMLLTYFAITNARRDQARSDYKYARVSWVTWHLGSKPGTGRRRPSK